MIHNIYLNFAHYKIHFIIFFIAVYDLVTLPFNSFIITLVIAIISFMATKSFLFTASVFVIPQLIRLMNIIQIILKF